jgi:hypothetical protein
MAVLSVVMLIALSMPLLAAVAPLSISDALTRSCQDSFTGSHSARSIVLHEWRRLSCLLLWIVLGPSLQAFALATASTNEIISNPWEISPAECLLSLAMLIPMILAFGIIAISVGLALGTWIKRRALAAVVSICVVLPIAIVWPLFGPGQLFTQLYTREPQLGGVGGWGTVALSLTVQILLAILFFLVTINLHYVCPIRILRVRSSCDLNATAC